jgi:dCMP deaminase
MNTRMTAFYMAFAQQCAQMSRARRLQVGAVIVKDDNIISFSWNGTPAGWDNNCEDVEWCSGGGWLSPEEIQEGWPYEGAYTDSAGNVMSGRYRLRTKPEVLHAERNALDKLAKKGNTGGAGATLYCTHAPCLECAKSIYGAGINNLYYSSDYRSEDGIYFLKKCGINVTKLMNVTS